MNLVKALLRLVFFWKKPRSVVPVVRLSGVIASSSQMRRGLSLEAVEPQLKKAFAIRGAKAVALIINSPGGSPVQSALIGKRVRDLARKANVPVLAFCEDVAASGGYWLAVCADEIYANAASVVGSIGVVSAGFGFDRAIEKLGVDRRVYTAGTNKMVPSTQNASVALSNAACDMPSSFIRYSRRGVWTLRL